MSGDQEYRSEEALPQLAKILAKYHGFNCTVLFAIDPADGTINVDNENNIPGLEALEQSRSDDHRHAAPQPARRPDEARRRLRCLGPAGHRTADRRPTPSRFPQDANMPTMGIRPTRRAIGIGGFGRRVLGETWVDHHGKHGQQSTRGIIAPGQADNPILRGIHDGDIWGTTDVYGVRLPLPADCTTLVLGQVLEGMNPDDKPVEGPQNNPMMPVAWSRIRTAENGKPARSFTTTMGLVHRLGERRAAAAAGQRRLLGRGHGRQDSGEVGGRPGRHLQTDAVAFGGSQKGLKPADLAPTETGAASHGACGRG